jgi:demethylmenaquinone methyltransferase / 2-methoxy-6-polyprenyl-1,4-benzoquinol methylase
VAVAETERNRRARELFAPLGPTYDRYAALLSFGQDPRWRRFLVSRIEARPGDTVLDVATGTAAVALELARRYGCSVVGVDQSPGMLAEATARVERAGLEARVRLEAGRAEELLFPEASFAGLTFTYLLRYVDDPAETLTGLARLVQPGGMMASLEFAIPLGAWTHAVWRIYVDRGLPLLGRLAAPAWEDVGRFLGPSIRDFWARYPLERQVEMWHHAGLRDISYMRLSLGGGIVIWGRRGH